MQRFPLVGNFEQFLPLVGTSHSASLVASEQAMYFASVVENATSPCLRESQEMGAPYTLKMWPPYHFRSALSPAKSESGYPTRGDASVEVVLGKTSLASAVALRYRRTRFAAVFFFFFLFIHYPRVRPI